MYICFKENRRDNAYWTVQKGSICVFLIIIIKKNNYPTIDPYLWQLYHDQGWTNLDLLQHKIY